MKTIPFKRAKAPEAGNVHAWLRPGVLAVLVGVSALNYALRTDVDPRVIGTYANKTGLFQAVAVSGNYAYVVGYRFDDGEARHWLEVVDLTIPTEPRATGRVGTSPYAGALAVSGTQTYALANWQEGEVWMRCLEIFDVADPANPKIVGRLVMDHGPTNPFGNRALVVSEGYAYVTSYWREPATGSTWAGRLDVIDVRNPNLPTIVGGIQTGGAQEVCVNRNYAYLLSYLPDSCRRLEAFDVSDPTNLRRVEPCDIIGGCTTSLAILGRYAYLSGHWAEDDEYGLRVFDVSEPARPVQVAALTSGRSSEPTIVGAAAAGTHLFLPSRLSLEGYDGLSMDVVDISDPLKPRLVSSSWGWAQDAALSGRYACVVNTFGLQIVDILHPANPQRVGQFGAGEYAADVAVSGNQALLAGEWFEGQVRKNGVRLIDVQDAAFPRQLACYEADDVSRAVISGEYGYLLASWREGSSLERGLEIIHLGDPTHVRRVARFVGCRDAFLAVSDQHACVASWRSDADVGYDLQLLDVSNPEHPIPVGRCDVGEPHVAAVAPPYVYVAGEWRTAEGSSFGLQVIDISNASSPVLVGRYSAPWDGSYTLQGSAVAIAGGHAYVVFQVWPYASNRLEIVDVSDAANPQRVGVFTGRRFQSLTVLGRYAYVTDLFGLQLLDIDDPRCPERVGGNAAFGRPETVVVQGDKVYVAGWDGLAILDKCRPLITLGRLQFSHEGPLTLSVSGPAGDTVRIQRSANLRDWEDWVALPLGERPAEVGDPEAARVPQRFYRALEE